jgi:hypothetical protein
VTAPTPAQIAALAELAGHSGPTGSAQRPRRPRQSPPPASALSWSLILHDCPSSWHSHPLQSFDGVAGGSFSAPDHEYPSYLELRLTATDSGGLTDAESIGWIRAR